VSKKIFIIDDADFMINMLSMMMRDAGYTVVGTALNGKLAVESIKSLSASALPDIITLDFHMPQMDGMSTIKHIRTLVPSARIILISSDSTMGVVMKAKNAGVDAFVVKPFEPQTVLDAIAKFG